MLTPLSNILFSADYWRIKVKQFIGNVPASFSINTCLNTGDPFYCSSDSAPTRQRKLTLHGQRPDRWAHRLDTL